MSAPRELIRKWRGHASELDEAGDAYRAHKLRPPEEKMRAIADAYRKCAEELDAALGRVS